MREFQKDFEDRNIQIVILTFEGKLFVRQYIQETEIDWPILIDEDRKVYASYRMSRAGFWDIWGLKTWLAYIKQLVKGQSLKKSEGDIFQRGGDVLIDPQGIIQLHHVGQGPADRPSAKFLLRIVDMF